MEISINAGILPNFSYNHEASGAVKVSNTLGIPTGQIISELSEETSLRFKFIGGGEQYPSGNWITVYLQIVD
jgi:hypothetical protein